MSENKFIKHLRGEGTAKSVLEIKNQSTTTSFANMPAGTSNANDVYSDHRGNATGVLKGSDNWKLNNSALLAATDVYGDGRDFTSTYTASGNTLWVDSTFTFDSEKMFTPNTKFVLKLCGFGLNSATADTIDFTLVVKLGSSIVVSKDFKVKEQAFEFSQEFDIDFDESNTTSAKFTSGDTMQVQLLCGDPTASATIYNGMTVFTALQRRVDGDSVASDKKTFDEAVQDIDDINEELDDLEEYVDDTFVRLDGASIMTAPLKFMSGSVRGAVGPYFNGVGFWKLDSQGNLTQIASISDSQFIPTTTNAISFGSSTKKWKDLYLDGKAYVATINNGADLAVPAKSGTLATMGDVELAARSGRMLTDQGVWYAKMYSATVPPSAEDDTNYADFSQVDNDNNPIIVIYTRTSGAWVQSEIITPPADYDGYVPITSKIWDIVEQSGQQGGRVLWNHTSKEFTPYPVIISFEDIEVTGESTVIMPYAPSANQIVNKDYVDTLVSNSIGDATITLTQGGQTMGSFTTNQSGDATIALDGGSSYRPDLFDWKWADHQVNDVQWLRADTFSWQAGSVYEAAYKHLRNDMYQWYSWEYDGTTIYTKKRYPEVGEKAYTSSALTTEFGEITEIDSGFDGIGITVGGNHYDGVTGASVVPTTETIAGVTVQYIPAEDGHKIVTDFHTNEVEAVYAATGVAWYYIIDYGFYRFKLPRTKFGVTGLRDTVGKYVEAGAPNITGNTTYNIAQFTTNGASGGNGAIRQTYKTNYAWAGGNRFDGTQISIDASRSSSVYGNSNTIQPPATQMYLYFYVGEFTQTAIENTAGLNAESFNDKVDVGHQVIAYQAPTSNNNYTWYRKYADGWVEQGGEFTVSVSNRIGYTTVTMPITMSDSHYTVSAQAGYIPYVSAMAYNVNDKYITTFQVQAVAVDNTGASGTPNTGSWYVCGIAA